MEKTREYFRSMISQRGVKQTFFRGQPEYNASWDYNISPDGRHFFSVCAEGPKIDAMLYEYIPETCEMIECVDTKKHIITYPRTIRPSKIHTCISFMEDGRVIMNNHTTAGAPSHPDWMTEAYYTHPWEGFPGSNVFIYDPKTGKTEDLGIPVPRESIYGGAYDPIHRAYYFSGYYRGHGYRLDLDTRQVTDYGQFCEYSVYFHTRGPDGNIYLSNVQGGMLRFNVHTQQIEHLKARIPMDPSDDESRCHNVMAYATWGKDGKLYLGAHKNEFLYVYDPVTDTIENKGSLAPAWYREKYKGLFLMFGVDFDSEGVLWYGLKVLGNCMRLVSWDVLHGGEPVDHGIVGTKEHASWNFCQAHIQNDVLYGTTTNHAVDGPAMMAIDLRVMREDVDKPRELGWDPIIYRGTADADLYPGGEKLEGPAAADATGPAPTSVAQTARARVHGGYAFADGILRQMPRNNQFSLHAGDRYVTKIWQDVGIENSRVIEVSHDENGNVISVSGSAEGGYYRTVSKCGEVLSWEKIEYTPKDPAVIAEKYKDMILPVPAGRAWLKDATCEAELADGSVLVGNKAGGLALVRDGKPFQLGFISMTGAIHDLAVSPDRRTVYGVAGDPEEMGLVFSYSMDFGLVSHGMLFFENGQSKEGTGCSCEPCCIDYAPDGKSIAIGVRDRLGCVYEYFFEEPPKMA